MSQARSLSAPSALTPVTQSGCFNEYPRGPAVQYIPWPAWKSDNSPSWSSVFGSKIFLFSQQMRTMSTTRVKEHWLPAPNKYTKPTP